MGLNVELSEDSNEGLFCHSNGNLGGKDSEEQ